ncbi:MAG: ARC6/PARC6 family protein, partial [Cyanobacteria bacterium J06641_5]
IARGFVGFQPEFLLEAASIFEKIGQRRLHPDVQIEKAVCALLLGRTEAATEVLQQSRDRKALDFIYQASKGAPDLLPGLCEFAKQWLQTEVLSEFRDLSKRRVTLTEYFADRNVQSALDRLAEAPAMRQRRRQPQRRPAALREVEAMPMASGYGQQFYPTQEAGSSERAMSPVMTVASQTVMQPSMATVSGGFSEAVPAGGGGTGNPSDRDEQHFVPYPGKKRRPRGRLLGRTAAAATPTANKVPGLVRPRQNLASWSLAVVGAAGVAIAVAGIWDASERQEAIPFSLEGEQLLVRLDAPPSILADVLMVETTAAAENPVVATREQAPAAVIEKWLSAKAKAYGPNADIAALGSVLTGVPLAQHQQWATELEQQGGYREFEHEIVPDTVRTLSQTSDRAVVEATVREVAIDRAQNGGNRAGVVLYKANLRVRYELAAAGAGVWKINAIKVQEKLSQD